MYTAVYGSDFWFWSNNNVGPSPDCTLGTSQLCEKVLYTAHFAQAESQGRTTLLEIQMKFTTGVRENRY